jgi:hypothetical protein
MKHTILVVAFIISIISTASAQVLLELKGSNLETDQPGVVMLLGPQTSAVTEIEFIQVFQCSDLENGRCLQYEEGTTDRTVELRIKSPLKKSEYFSFYIIYDVAQDDYVVKFKSYSPSELKFKIRNDSDRTIIEEVTL